MANDAVPVQGNSLAGGDNAQHVQEIDKSQQMAAAVGDVIKLSNLYIHKNYLQDLNTMPIVPASRELTRIKIGTNLRLLRISGILHDGNESLSEKVKSLFGAVSAFDAGVMLILQAKGDRAEFYIGICGNQADVLNQTFNTFTGSLKGILPGCKYRNVKLSEVDSLMEEIFPNLINTSSERLAVSAVSTFPTAAGEISTNDSYAAIEKIDVLLDGMRGKPFSMILLTKNMSKKLLTDMQHQMELIYTQLSMFERQTFSTSKSDTDSVTLNYSRSLNSNQSYSTGFTRGISNTHSEGLNSSISAQDDQSRKTDAKLGLLGTAASLAVPLAAAAVLPAGMTAMAGVAFSAFLGNSIARLGKDLGVIAGATPNPKHRQEGTNTADSKTDSETKNVTFSVSKGTTDSSGYAIGNNRTLGSSRQYTITNKSVSIILEELDKEIHQMQRLSREGAFSGAAYFVAGNTENAVTAANIYRSMTESKSNGSRTSSLIYHWNDAEKVDELTKYLVRGCHPSFTLEDDPHQPTVEAAQIIGITDVPVYFSFPKKSVPGIVISDYAGFARDIILQDTPKSLDTTDRTVNTGYVYHYGKIESQTPINLRIDDLTKHLFVAGATGVGKSNFCYQLLDQLADNDVKILVIEPAKGEYAGVLGGREGFHVFGADAMRSPLLRINPFAFPEGISTTQHIERLLSIFNTAWTMYDAMPAILKDALEKIYLDRGFDLYFGGKPDEAQFPSFNDLLAALPAVIQSSSYSNEIKGNYTGALVTRVKSLTNGLYRMIFTQNELGDEILFGNNVIVDISRIGSAETKALVMGILTMRLSEYRMCEGKVNSPLRHVTLLEEAHNLLRRNNSATAGGGDLKAASVEMITNAIAEMRTYGEGFIIADQSPSVLDLSVIRNTNTKVFFMLPDRNDREISGDSLTLTEPQKRELARLSPGVAAVYQNGWTSSVLCKINYFKPDKVKPFVYGGLKVCKDIKPLISQALAVILSNLLPKDKRGSVDEAAIRQICTSDEFFLGDRAMTAIEILREYSGTGAYKCSGKEYQEKIASLISLEKAITQADTGNWAELVETQILNEVTLSNDELIVLVQYGIRRYLPNNQFGKMSAKYLSYRKSVEH